MIALTAATYLWITTESNPGPGDPYVGFVGTIPIVIGLMVLTGLVEERIGDRLFRTIDPA